MSNTEQHLKRIQDKLQQLLKEYTAMQKENSRLKEELRSAREKSSGQQKNVDELKQQISILKVSTGDMSEADKKEFEKRINGYLKEIDKCIAMLGE
jgi:predicted  nucleic acid-binding Zn-ribbon protein